ncbi:MAG: TIGR02147 family protein [Bacteriovoracaceae bacterium]|nr:TIGR02147 family protein [Bacteriovoracaceae bacterium]
MKDKFPPSYFRDYLTEELEKRSTNNPKYSLRAFARDLKISPQRLSDLIRGRYGLSGAQAKLIAEGLCLSSEEQRRFISSAEMLHARSELKRRKARQEFQQSSKPVSSLTLDAFKIISDWYHYAILELTYTKDFNSDASWIASCLEISKFTAEKAIERLKRLDLLVINKNGALKCTSEFVATPTGIPSNSLRKFHKQLLEKAINAIDVQTVGERDFGSTIMAIDQSCLDDAKQDLKKFRHEFMKKYGAAQHPTDVYCLGVQFFRLQNKTEIP